MANPHPGDALVQDVADYVESTSDKLVEGLLGSPLAPQTAPLTEAQKTQYFANQFWNPDGTPNQAGRDTLQAKYGAQGFMAIAAALSRQHAKLARDATDGQTLPDLGDQT